MKQMTSIDAKGWLQIIPQRIMVREFDKTTGEKILGLQKDMFIRIEDMKLLNVDTQNH
jgi:hypothetical protein